MKIGNTLQTLKTLKAPPVLTVDELTRLAFIRAEQDRASLADAWPYGSPEHESVKAEYLQLKAYRLKRWGKTAFESMIAGAKSKNILDVKDA